MTDSELRREAITRTASYFGHRPVRGDEGWVVVQASAALGPSFVAWASSHIVVSPDVREVAGAPPLDIGTAEARFWGLRALRELPLPPLSPPHDVAPSSPSSVAHSDADLETIKQVMVDAIACARQPPENRKDVLHDVRPAGHGYVLTHQLLALMLAYNQRCVDRSDIAASRLELAVAVWREQAADPRIDDLALERMAVLCYAQLCEWVAPSWIDAVVREQNLAGTWGNRDLHIHPKASAGESHTAALGFYVLAEAWRLRHEPGEKPPDPPAD